MIESEECRQDILPELVWMVEMLESDDLVAMIRKAVYGSADGRFTNSDLDSRRLATQQSRFY